MMKRKVNHFVYPFLMLTMVSSVVFMSCSVGSKLKHIHREQLSAAIGLARESDIQTLKIEQTQDSDTLLIEDSQGNELIIMKAVKDHDGEMVATDILNAAVVEARFRNVAERHGLVDIEFQIRVPQTMYDPQWQLRFYPQLYILSDTLQLEPLIVTGSEYRKGQLKGYDQYNRFLRTIISDTTRFINLNLLELFIQRNIPDLYALKTDSTYVPDAQLNSIYGVTEKDAVDHYTNKISKQINARRMSRREKMFRKFVKVPIVHEGLRLDTVLNGANGEFIYNYIQTIRTRPQLRKVEVVLNGDIYEKEKNVYTMPQTHPLTYYISSLSAFVDNSVHYKKKVITRRAEANTACYIDFKLGDSQVIDTLSNNTDEILRIKDNLTSLIENKDFDLDSIVVLASCSPEGKLSLNQRLAYSRSLAVTRYFSDFIEHYRDSLEANRPSVINLAGYVKESTTSIRLIPRNNPENWRMLDALVEVDSHLTEREKTEYFSFSKEPDLDKREGRMKNRESYRYFREHLYPRLRTVKFNFFLHRKGMVKDTVCTTVIDDIYMQGVQAIKDRDYEKALTLLRPYKDYNTAIAYMAMDYNASALDILEHLPETDQVNYMLAIIYSRKGNYKRAVECYMRSCEQNPMFVHRGNLDPEISSLIKHYGLHKEN